MENNKTLLSAAELDRATIREIFLRNGFTIKEGQIDLKPYVYEAAEDLLAQARLAAQPVVAPADEFAINFIKQRAEQYLQDHADTDPGTGAVVFQYGEAGLEYHSTLVELADDIRAALAQAGGQAPAACAVPPTGWHCTRAAGHDGPCAAHPITATPAAADHDHSEGGHHD